MDNLLYDTSWNLYSISSASVGLRTLLDPSTPANSASDKETLDKHNNAFRQSLGRKRPRYEEQEEKDKIGGLRMCTWSRLHPVTSSSISQPDSEARKQPSIRTGQKRKHPAGPDREDIHDDSTPGSTTGVVISILYDKTTYRFVLLTASSTTELPTTKKARTKQTTRSSPRTRTQETQSSDTEKDTILLLAKCNPATFKALTTYLDTTFAVSETNICPLKIPAHFLQRTLETYMSSTYEELTTTAVRTHSRGRAPSSSANFKSIFGTLRMTITFGPPVAPKLKSLDVELPSETVLTALNEPRRSFDSDDDNNNNKVTAVVAEWIENRTGLKLPLTSSAMAVAHYPVSSRDDDNHGDAEKENRRPSSQDQQQHDTSEKETTSTDERTTTTTTTESLAAPPPPPPPMRLSRIMSAAYALSSEGRLKFSAKAMELCEQDQGDDEDGVIDDQHNMVRKANQTLLQAMLQEAGRQRAG